VHDGSSIALEFLARYNNFDFDAAFVADNSFVYDEEAVQVELDDPVVSQVISDATVALAREAKVREDFASFKATPLVDPLEPVITTDLVQGIKDTVLRVQDLTRAVEEAPALKTERCRQHLVDLIRRTFIKANARSQCGDVLSVRSVTLAVQSNTIFHIRNPDHLAEWARNCIAKMDHGTISFGMFSGGLYFLVVVAVVDNSSLSAITPAKADCLVVALARSLGVAKLQVQKAFMSLLGADMFAHCMETDGLSLLHLDGFGKRCRLRVRIIVSDADIWGDFPTIVGDLTADKLCEVAWSPGHWSSEQVTLRGASPTVPDGAGLLWGFPSHAQFAVSVNKPVQGAHVSKTSDGVYYVPCVYTNGFSAQFNEHISFFSGPVVEPLVAVRDVAPDPVIAETYENLPSDAYRLLSSVFPAFDENPLYPAANTLESQLVSDNFRAGVFNPDAICEVNMRGHLRKPPGFFSLGMARALYYEKGNAMQTLQVISERYANKHIRQFNYCSDAEAVANQIADRFAFDCFQSGERPFDNAELNAIMVECETAMRIKHYEAQTDPDSPDTRVVRFHLKDIAKPKVGGNINLMKAGQGISAWSKTAQSWFGKAMRILNARFGSLLVENVIYDNRMTEEELISSVNAQLRKLHPLATPGVSDCDQFDSVQNKFTQAIERRVLKRLGASDVFLDAYYSFRSNYLVQSSHVRARCLFEKTSGEPGTLLLNTILSMVLTYFIFEGDGNFVIVAKGDDGFRSQLNLRVSEDNLALVNKFCQLGLKLSFDETVEFCGNVIVGGVFYPSIYRKLAKLSAHRFRSYEHFCEYQISLRDWETKVAKADMHNLCAVNAVVYGTSVRDAYDALSCVRSFAHINKAQFHSTFKWAVPVLGHYVAGKTEGSLGFVQY